jgi:hypothetical protein
MFLFTWQFTEQVEQLELKLVNLEWIELEQDLQ